ncbi:ralA-binding protein 1-like [Biomphalaria glabrata]|uniref:RalA-binding protein 1-like n=1 Tax=Biomphalaria glabrata TaxID=6526 RepID=A0A9W3A672_BIOGL|nr:ralA-binding protein 1-like [Biomphalaria glabrata]XP_055882822.1 ralA-binding protein 1-like [Biomphalaria glabrata]
MSFESQESDVYPVEDDKKRDSSRKRDGKKEKKEKGYQMFEEEDSEEERLVLAEEIKSPSKVKKEKLKPSFKFPVPVRKEKTKEKEEKKDKEAKEDKEKKKEDKKKSKLKDKKKLKPGPHDSANVIVEASVNENPIFGVALALAVERNKSHDGIELPAIVRECIDYIEECGLACEGIYRISGVKSKVQHLKDCYNRHQPVHLFEHEPNIVASLLKQFLRDLPEPVLTTALMPKFEEASTFKNNKKKVEAFSKLIADLPTCNRLLLSWMIVHMTHVIELAKENKMTLQNVSIVLSPTMQISHRVLNVLFSNVTELFGDVLLRKYIPPLKPAHSKWSLELPDNPSALEEELAKQESLLNQLHAEVNSGREDEMTVEQLWEVQRVVTQLKRKIKTAKKNVEMAERRRTNLEAKRSSTASIPSLSAPEDLQLSLRLPPEQHPSVTTVTAVVEKHPDSEMANHADSHTEVKKGVKFVESTKKTRAPQIGEIKKIEDGKKIRDGEELSEKAETKPAEAEVETVKEKVEKKTTDKESEIQTSKHTEDAEHLNEKEASTEEKRSSHSVDTSDKGLIEKENKALDAASDVTANKPQDTTQVLKSTTESQEASEITAGIKDEPKAEKEACVSGETIKEQTPVTEDVVSAKVTKELKPTTVAEEVKPIKVTESANLTEDAKPGKVTEDVKSDKIPEGTKSAKATDKALPAKVIEDDKTANVNEDDKSAIVSGMEKSVKVPKVEEAAHQEPKPQKEEVPPKPSSKVEYVYRKPPNPPFMSTALLQPMKAEIPKPKPPSEATDDKKEHIRKSEELRELEEELLGEKKKKIMESNDEEYDIPDDVDIEQLLDEEYALKLEEEELLAIADELRQKIATERSEMERLAQEIQELQYLRQDSDLEDLSSSSSSSEESEDEDDLQELLDQLIQDNEKLEMNNADLCQKIHEERMICLSVKLQIRLLQQKHLESSYG